MSSPVIHFFETIDIQSDTSQAIYIQIAQQITDAIQRGILPAGSKLPGTRQIAQIIGVHRKTVVAAFEELNVQDWVKTYPNKGTYVIENNLAEQRPLKSNYSKKFTPPSFSFKQTHLFDLPDYPQKTDYFFTDGTPDIRINAVQQWQKYYTATARRKTVWNNQKWYLPHRKPLHAQLSNYLNITRGLRISSDNLLITQNAGMSLYLLTEILLDKEDTIAVAEKNYYKANMIFQKNGTKVKAIPTDKEGMNIDELEKICQESQIRAVYVMPHAHYPTTVSLSKTRRLKLLNLARQYDFIIIEDDWDYDLQYEKMSSLPLYSADDNDRVIYIGEIGKNLIPGYQAGFVAGNENLIRTLEQFSHTFTQGENVLMQMTLAEMLEEGEIQKHIKKSKKIYQQRRDYFGYLLNEWFSEDFDFSFPHGGLAFWLESKNRQFNLMKISQKCLENKLYIPPNLLYQNQKESAMRLGFGHLNEQEAEKCLKILKETITEQSTKVKN